MRLHDLGKFGKKATAVGLFGKFFFVLVVLEALTFWFFFEAAGFWETIGLGMLSCMIGLVSVQASGANLAFEARAHFARSAFTVENLLGSLALLLAGFLFVFPGFVSDVLGFALLIPAVRAAVQAKAVKPFAGPNPPPRPYAEEGVIEGDFERVTDAPQPLERPN